MSQTTSIQLQNDFQKDLQVSSKNYLDIRGCNNPEFSAKFNKVLTDMLYSQTDDGIEALKKARPQSLFNAVFRASEIGASFAKKEISVLPFAASKTVKEGGVTKKIATGQNDLVIVVDINFQKQQILKMPNCKKFFTAEVTDGVQIYRDLTTGEYVFEGKNDVTKPTIGYYACFITTDGEVYPLFMTCGEIVDRARFNPGFNEKNYANTKNSIHYEKIVVRNLLKIIPNISDELKSILILEGSNEVQDVDHVVIDEPVNQLEEAKKELAEKSNQQREEEFTSDQAKESDSGSFF